MLLFHQLQGFHRAHPAGRALTTRLFGKEVHDVARRIRRFVMIRKNHDRRRSDEAAVLVQGIEIERNVGRADVRCLERAFQGLMLNFNWWVNRKDPEGRNVFAGGFLGLDNIGVFDRSAPLPTGGSLEQADGTAWMAFYCQSMLEMALILAEDDQTLEGVVLRVRWINPHMILYLQSKDEKGELEEWVIHGSSPSNAVRQVGLKDRLQPGISITARVWPSRIPLFVND